MPAKELQDSFMRLRPLIHEIEAALLSKTNAELHSFCVDLIRKLSTILVETIRISVGQQTDTASKITDRSR
jgi:hypothetical protein